jgi:hypothetical protein
MEVSIIQAFTNLFETTVWSVIAYDATLSVDLHFGKV